jgi:hypothetical protein
MFKPYYMLALLAAFAIGCGDKDSEDTGSEDTSAPTDSGDTADSGDSGDTGEGGDTAAE